MTKELSFFERLRAMIVETFGVQEEKVTLKMTFDDLGADSLDIMELVMEVEDMENVHFEDDRIMNLKTVDDIVSYVESQKTKNDSVKDNSN